MSSPVHIDGVSPARLSLNVTVGNQTQNRSFGEKVNMGLQQGAAAIASGAGILGSAGIPGGAIVSAAVSSVSSHLGAAGGTSSTGYAATGAVNLPGSSGALNTTAGSSSAGSMVNGTTTGSVNYNSGSTTNDVGFGNSSISSMSGDMSSMLQLQFKMQKENLMYTGISNVLKTKHETVKNSVSNIR